MEMIKILGPTVIAFAAALVGLYKYINEKNRQIYERRLNEVYAPLYGHLVAQETFRQMYMKDTPIIEVPILTMDKTKVKAVLDLTNGSVTSESSTETGIIDRKNFKRILKDKVNSGLATPRLLIAINQYELMVYLEESFEQDSPEWITQPQKKLK